MFRRALVVASIATPAAAAPVPKGTGSKLYFPTAVGAKWVYATARGGEEAVEVSGVEEKDGRFVVSRAGADGNDSRYDPVAVSADGLEQDQEQDDGEKKPVWLLKVKAKAGDVWDAAGGKRTAGGPEAVEVPAGKFAALRVSWEKGGVKYTSWYAPGVGEVKRTRTLAGGAETVARSLKSFTPAK